MLSLHADTDLMEPAEMATHVGCSKSSATGGAMSSSSNGRVRISVDDTMVLHGETEALRAAQSLNRLDTLEEGQESKNDLYKCPSFPRLQPGGHNKNTGGVDPSRTFSTTHLETESLSPRVSTDNLTNISKDSAQRRRDRLSLGLVGVQGGGGSGGLTRSISSRVVNEYPSFPPLETPRSQVDMYLSPLCTAYWDAPAEKTSWLVSRSTSCPSMAQDKRSPSMSPRSPDSPQRSRRLDGSGQAVASGMSPRDLDVDVNLDGEEITDLPIEPGRQFPEFLQESSTRGKDARVAAAASASNNISSVQVEVSASPSLPPGAGGASPTDEEHPMHTRRLHMRNKHASISGRHNGEQRSRSGHREKPRNQFVNIGDIPCGIAEKVISDGEVYKPPVDVTARRKCLMWLNSLDNDQEDLPE